MSQIRRYKPYKYRYRMSESKFERVGFISSPEYLKAVKNFRKAEIAYLKVGEELYPSSLRYNKIPRTLFCRFILGEFNTHHTARFLIILIKIYEHFVIFLTFIDYEIEMISRQQIKIWRKR